MEGNDPGHEFIADMNFLYNEDGFSGHPNFTKWLEQEIEAAVTKIQADYQTSRQQPTAGDLSLRKN